MRGVTEIAEIERCEQDYALRSAVPRPARERQAAWSRAVATSSLGRDGDAADPALAADASA